MKFGAKALLACSGVGCLAAIAVVALVVVGSLLRPPEPAPKSRGQPQGERDRDPGGRQRDEDQGPSAGAATVEARVAELRELLERDMPFLALKEARALRKQVREPSRVALVEELIEEIQDHIRAEAKARAKQRSGERQSNLSYANPSDLRQARRFLDDLPAACAQSRLAVARDGTVTIFIACEGASGSMEGSVKFKDGVVTEIR